MATRDYIYYELTNSICTTCLGKVEAKIIFQNDNVYMLKHCLEHGRQKVLISTDIEYYKKIHKDALFKISNLEGNIEQNGVSYNKIIIEIKKTSIILLSGVFLGYIICSNKFFNF